MENVGKDNLANTKTNATCKATKLKLHAMNCTILKILE